MSHSRKTNALPRRSRTLVPWLVKEGDLRRYLGRAVTVCDRGRVIFFFHIVNGRRKLLSLVRLKEHDFLLSAARADFAQGRYKTVSLERLRRTQS